jgi:hypothetical protein
MEAGRKVLTVEAEANGGLSFWDVMPRRSAEAGQDFFPWLTTHDAASHPKRPCLSLQREYVIAVWCGFV